MPENDGNAELLAELMPDIVQFHQLSKGGIESIGLLLSEIAEKAIAPQVLCHILGVDNETIKSSIEAGTHPTVTEAQLVKALEATVKPGCTIDMIAPIFRRRIQRFENAKKVMETISPEVMEFHRRVGGRVDRVAAFFADLAPVPQKGRPMPQGLIYSLLRIKPSSTICQVEELHSCLERHIDVNDDAEGISKVLTEHTQPHVVFLQLSAPGHINPTIPLVAAFVRRGCRVSYFANGGGSRTDAVRRDTPLGQSVLAAGAQLHNYCVDPRLQTEPALQGSRGRNMMWYCLPRLLADLQAMQPPPSCVLYDPFGGMLATAADILKIPRIALLQTAGPGIKWEGEASALEEERRKSESIREWVLAEYQVDLLEVGLPPRSWFSPVLNLVLTSKAFYAPLSEEQKQSGMYTESMFRCIGTMIQAADDFRTADSSFPLDEIRQARDTYGKRIIYLSLGSMVTGSVFDITWHNLHSIHGNVDPDDRRVEGKTLSEMTGADFTRMVFCHSFAALGDRDDMLVVVSCGGRGVEEVLAKTGFGDADLRPANFRFFAVVPQLALLPLCSCHITHGGTGSMMESLTHRVPVVAIPAFADMIANTDSAVKAGLGVGFRYPLLTLSTEALRDAVLAVVDDHGPAKNRFMAALEAAATEIEEMGGPDKTVALVLEQVKENLGVSGE